MTHLLNQLSDRELVALAIIASYAFIAVAGWLITPQPKKPKK